MKKATFSDQHRHIIRLYSIISRVENIATEVGVVLPQKYCCRMNDYWSQILKLDKLEQVLVYTILYLFMYIWLSKTLYVHVFLRKCVIFCVNFVVIFCRWPYWILASFSKMVTTNEIAAILNTILYAYCQWGHDLICPNQCIVCVARLDAIKIMNVLCLYKIGYFSCACRQHL